MTPEKARKMYGQGVYAGKIWLANKFCPTAQDIDTEVCRILDSKHTPRPWRTGYCDELDRYAAHFGLYR